MDASILHRKPCLLALLALHLPQPHVPAMLWPNPIKTRHSNCGLRNIKIRRNLRRVWSIEIYQMRSIKNQFLTEACVTSSRALGCLLLRLHGIRHSIQPWCSPVSSMSSPAPLLCRAPRKLQPLTNPEARGEAGDQGSMARSVRGGRHGQLGRGAMVVHGGDGAPPF